MTVICTIDLNNKGSIWLENYFNNLRSPRIHMTATHIGIISRDWKMLGMHYLNTHNNHHATYLYTRYYLEIRGNHIFATTTVERLWCSWLILNRGYRFLQFYQDGSLRVSP